MKAKLVSLLFTVALAPAVVAALSPLTLDPAQRRAFGIETVAAQPAGAAVSKPYPAKVSVPNAQLRVVSAPLEGVVEALLVAEGEAVAQDQPLARLRSQGLLELQAAYLESRTRRLLSAETLARDRKLHAEGIVAQRRLLETQAAHRERVTAEQRDRQMLLLAGMSPDAVEQLAESQQLSAALEVKSPLSGIVLEQIATAGQRLAMSDPLYRVGDLSTLWIEVHVPLEALGAIGPGSTVELPEGLSARVITVGRMVHGTDQGVLVRAEIRTGAERLRPGQFVEARLSQVAGASALRLPARALVRIGGAEQVFVERAGAFVPVAVEILSRETDTVVVRGPFAAGEFVVVSGTAALKAALAAGAP